MVSLAYIPPSSFAPNLWLFLLALVLLPCLNWIAHSRQRRRLAGALIVALLLSAGTANALIYDPGWCCPDYVEYGLCLPWCF